MTRTLLISELFISIQGEGPMIGRPTVFVRTGGCDYKCSWCDTLYAVLPEYKEDWKRMTVIEVFREIQRLSAHPVLVTLSGGNPALQPCLPELIELGHRHGYRFCMESQGSAARAWFRGLDYLVLSPKPPSSGMTTNWDRLTKCVEMAQEDDLCKVAFKVVVFDDADYAFAHTVAERFPYHLLYLQAGNPHPPQHGPFQRKVVLEKLDWLMKKVLEERWNKVLVLPQLHTLLWGNSRGV